jgi:hypothetical protein
VNEVEESDSEVLNELADAIGQPPRSTAEKAKALFPLIAREAGTDNREPGAASECGPGITPPPTD